MAGPKPQAFTLIELLVVVTIIVVLLALLVPAMDKAIYQAELATCGANLKAIGTAMNIYASEQKRRYPHRSGVHDDQGFDTWWRETSVVTLLPYGPYDDRPMLRPYLAINKSLNCPLNEELDIDGSVSNTESPYQLWFGFAFRQGGGAPERGMLKIGDRMRFTNTGTGDSNSFDLLASDQDTVVDDNGAVYGSHPDRDGNMSQHSQQDEVLFSISRWQMLGTPPNRGKIDRNFVHGDGSVSRLTDYTFEEARNEERNMAKVPTMSNSGNFPVWWTTLPHK